MALNIPLLGYFQRKNIYSGAHVGMRYRVRQAEEIKVNDEGKETKERFLELVVWPDPWAIEKTNPELHRKFKFSATEESCTQIVETLTQIYEDEKQMWDNCPSILDAKPWVAPKEVEEENGGKE